MTAEIRTRAADDVLDRIRCAHAAGQALMLLSDYDGTLTETAERPDLARLTAETRQILHGLAEQPGVHLGIISGRSLSDLKQLVGLDRILLVGTSGQEMELDGTIILPSEAENLRAMIADAGRRARDFLAGEPDAWVEEKPFGLTLQLADASPDSRQRICTWINCDLLSRDPRLRVIECSLGLEILPDNGVTKATAIRRFLDRVQVDTPFVVYAGNDANDSDALAFVSELGGVAIGIGPASPKADHHFQEPAQFVSVLETLLERVSQHALRTIES